MKVGVLRFPGTNCDFDVLSMAQWKGHDAKWLWHQDRFDVNDVEMVLVPGGFSYGDYLRCGALAARSPAMQSVIEFSKKGKPILGICNGFQILCEAGLLPGALVRNESLQFIDEWAELELRNASPHFAKSSGKSIRLPIAHGEGRFYADSRTLQEIQDNGQIWWQYKGKSPNGSLLNIAGLMNKEKNVAALMPHPERAFYEWMGGQDGEAFL